MSAFLSALFAIAKALPELIKLGKLLHGMVKTGSLESFLKDTRETFEDIEKSQTPAERKAAARNLARLASRL